MKKHFSYIKLISDAFDYDFMLSTLKDMVAGNEVILPEYNYKTNSRFVFPYMIMVNINYSNVVYMYHL